MPWLRFLIFCLVTLLLAGCSTPLIPPANAPSITRQQQPDADLLCRLQGEWNMLQQAKLTPQQRAATQAAYNADLLLLVRRLRHDGAPGVDVCYMQTCDRKGNAIAFEDVIPAADVPLDSLEERYTEPGLGVPMVGIIPRVGSNHQFAVGSRGAVCMLTAVLRFTRAGKPELMHIPRYQENTIRVGRYKYQLAADWSAALEMYWNLTRIKKDRWLGLLRPQEVRSTTGLFSIQPYNPDRIPVILTHGLASTACTFDNLVNRLVSDPVIRENYQFWYFNYPTGLAWTISAREYRQAIENLRREVDPERKNRNWDKLVVVGHSMGGLITHYSQCEEPWNLLRSSPIPLKLLQSEYRDKPFENAEFESLRKDYFFRPVKAGLVVYMATPHRGAPLAQYYLVTALTKLVTLPKTLLEEAYNIATLQEDTMLLNPQEAYLWFTSIHQLDPDSYSIRGLQGLKVRNAQTHSIIGDRGCSDCPRCSDGVVPYWSSHISWGTQTIVPAGHSVQDSMDTAADMRKLLTDYARKHPVIKTSARQKQRVPSRCTGLQNHPDSAGKK
ncbi:MAG: hypothetical protein IKY92_08110 [Akkermansia sp.]|nr:hypothetical protein [Akkermansia sp.]